MTEKMNIYQKLQKCRVELQKSDLKKSGRNEFSNYDYFELGDFLPRTNELFAEHGLIGVVAPGESAATLTIIDTDKPEDNIIFYCANAEISLKGAHAIQNIGAVKTYQRRYLWIDAMEISEKDAVDRSEGKADKGKPAEWTFEVASKHIISFGKHSGKTLGDIYDKHPDYVDWYMEKGTDNDIKAAFAVIVNHFHGEMAFEKTIDEVKIKTIKDKMKKTNTPEKDVLDYCKVDCIENMTTDMYVKAMKVLEAKSEKLAKNNEPELPM